MSDIKMSIGDKITLGLLVSMSFFLMCDLYITPGIVTELAAEYHVAESNIGYVGSAFVLIGAIISIFFGYMADKASRKRLLVATVLIGEIPCFMTGLPFFTPDLKSFFILRILTGIGVGGIYPLTFSLISDYFSARHRAFASATIDIAWGLGMMAGPMLAAFAVSTGYGWRLAYILAALPNLPIALIFIFVARDPERGRTEDALEALIQDGLAYSQKIKLSDFKIIFKTRTNLLLFLQGIPGCIPWGILPFWIITFMETQRGFTKIQATTIWELFGIGTVTGGILWAILGDKLFNKKPSYLPMVCTAGVFIGTIMMFGLLNIPISPQTLTGLWAIGFFTMAFMTGIFISVPSSNNKAILMNINRPEHRGSVFAVFNITDNIGKGIGPALGGILLSSGYTFTFMMNFAISWWILCAAIFSLIIFTITSDRQRLLDHLDIKAKEMSKGTMSGKENPTMA
ncbi:MAG: MFS transporter [Thermodesulfobacteriota bacterium]|nr:MFS transporter [Thermodesulfobacteriota bacterium]